MPRFSISHNKSVAMRRVAFLKYAFVLSLLVPVVLAPSAFAATLGAVPDPATTYTWQDRQTISISGGSVKPGQKLLVDINDNNPTSTKGIILVSQEYIDQNCSFLFWCKQTTELRDCRLPLALTFTNNASKATLGIYDTGQEAYDPNNPPPDFCSQDVNDTYAGKTVSLGTRPSSASTTAETDAQKRVSITVVTRLKDADAPATIKVNITGGSTQTLTSSSKTNTQGDVVQYSFSTKLEPGNYTARVSGLTVDKQSETFEKKKFEARSLLLGDTEGYGDRQINVIVEMNFDTGGGPSAVVGPYDITLYDPEGATVKTAQTNSTESVGTSSTTAANYTLRTVLEDVDPGNYKICVGAGTEFCKDIVKAAGSPLPVTLTFTGASANKLTTAAAVANGDVADNCPLEAGASMRWLGCSIFFGIKGTADKVGQVLDDLLFTNTDTLFSPSTLAATDFFRNVGIVLIVIAGLFMVISQALGFEFLDAYTVRKLMPRLGVALIGIALAFPILRIVVTLTNDLGGLIYSVLLSIPEAAGATGSSADIGTGVGEVLGGIGVVGVGLGIFAFLGPSGALSLFATFLLGILIGLLVLSVRQLIIFIAVIMAPLAIAASVIPGGQKLWGFWKNSLLTALFMYPLIMAFIGAGAAMAYLIASTTNPENPTVGIQSSMLALIIYFAPFFMLPFAFKMTGGLMGTIFSIANDKNRGAFDRLSKYRQGRSAANMERMKQGTRFGDGSRLGHAFNQGTRGAASINADNLGYNPRQWRNRLRTTMEDQAHDAASEFGEKSPEGAAIFGDDAKVWASQHTDRTRISNALAQRDPGRFAGEANARARNDATNQILRAQRATNGATFQRARVRAQAKTGTGYQDANGAFNVGMMLDDINSAYGDDRTGSERALAEMRNSLVGAGQIAGQAGFGDWAGALSARRTGGAGSSDVDVQRRVMGGAIDTASPSYALHGKPSSAAAMATESFNRIQDINRSMNTNEAVVVGRNERGEEIRRVATQEDLHAMLGAMDGVYEAMGQSSPANASAYANAVMGQRLEGSTETIQQMITRLSSSSYENAPEYHNRKKSLRAEIDRDEASPQFIEPAGGVRPQQAPH